MTGRLSDTSFVRCANCGAFYSADREQILVIRKTIKRGKNSIDISSATDKENKGLLFPTCKGNCKRWKKSKPFVWRSGDAEPWKASEGKP